MDWQRKKVLVTGGAGFIGSHLTEHLVERGVKPRVLVRYGSSGTKGWIDKLPEHIKDKIEVLFGDIRDADTVKKAVQGIDVIFHLAALVTIPYSYIAPQSFVATNIRGTLNILQAAAQQGVESFVHTSSSEVYGSAQYVPMDEKHPLSPQSPYAASKVSADALAMSFFCSFDLPVSIVRPFNAYGPRQTPRAVIPTIILQYLKNRTSGKPIKIGNLESRRDMTFVKDTARGFLQVAQNKDTQGQIINVGFGKDYSIKEILGIIGKHIGVELPIDQQSQRFRPKKSEVSRLLCDNSKAMKICGWKPQHSLEEGLKQSISWFEQHSNLFDPDRYSI